MIDSDSNSLPQGWSRQRIDALCDVNPKKPARNGLAPDAMVTFVPMPAVDADAGAITAPVVRPFVEVRKGFTSFVNEDVIIAKITPCFENGKAAVCRSLANGIGFGSTEFHVLRSKGSILPEYLYHFVRQESLRHDGEANMTGSVGQKRVPADWLKAVEIPLPPMAEQRRIVTKVEAMLARVNHARDRLAKLPALLKRFRQSILAAACSGKLTAYWRDANCDAESAAAILDRVRENMKHGKISDFIRERCRKKIDRLGLLDGRVVDATNLPDVPASWSWIFLPQSGYMNRGKSRNRPRNASHLYGGPYPFIQTGDIARSGGKITTHTQTYSEAGLQQSRLWPPYTICITIAANIANTALLTYPACFPDSVVGLCIEPTLADANFVEFFLRTTRDDLSQFAPATAQKNINVEILNDVALPLPPLAEQHEIVRRVKALFALAEKIETCVSTAAAQADKLIQSTLAKAFRGELVPIEDILQQASPQQREVIEAGMAVLYVLALLYTWKASPDRRTFELGMILMQKDDLRRRVVKGSRVTTIAMPRATAINPKIGRLDELIGQLAGTDTICVQNRKTRQLISLGAKAPPEAELVSTSVGKDVFAKAHEAIKAVESLSQIGQSLDQYASAEEYDAIEIAIS